MTSNWLKHAARKPSTAYSKSWNTTRITICWSRTTWKSTLLSLCKKRSHRHLSHSLGTKTRCSSITTLNRRRKTYMVSSLTTKKCPIWLTRWTQLGWKSVAYPTQQGSSQSLKTRPRKTQKHTALTRSPNLNSPSMEDGQEGHVQVTLKTE